VHRSAVLVKESASQNHISDCRLLLLRPAIQTVPVAPVAHQSHREYLASCVSGRPKRLRSTSSLSPNPIDDCFKAPLSREDCLHGWRKFPSSPNDIQYHTILVYCQSGVKRLSGAESKTLAFWKSLASQFPSSGFHSWDLTRIMQRQI